MMHHKPGHKPFNQAQPQPVCQHFAHARHDWLAQVHSAGYIRDMSSAPGKYPLATIAPYGPNARQATKLVVAVFPRPQKEPDALRKWTVPDGDIRQDAAVNEQVVAFLKEHNVAHAAVADRILGCPHEEGIDYPIGEPCPVCPFWAGRNRFAHRTQIKANRNDPCPCGSGRKFKKCCGIGA